MTPTKCVRSAPHPSCFGLVPGALTGGLACLADGAGQPAAGATEIVPIVMLVLDEFSVASIMDGRRIDRGAFPNLARLADESTWYRNATTVADGTIHAVPAIMTGHLRRGDVLPHAQAYPPSVFDRLGESWDFHVHEPAPASAPPTCALA